MRIAAYQPDIALNVGALIRLCACLDAGLDVIEPCGFPFSLGAVRRSAMDYVDLVDIRRHVSWEGYQRDRGDGRLILLTTRAARRYDAVDYQPSDTLLLGRESAGAPESVHDVVDERVVIPMADGARSLNVAMAAAIVLAEAKRSAAGR